jgi:hypothetical protein
MRQAGGAETAKLSRKSGSGQPQDGERVFFMFAIRIPDLTKNIKA